MLKTIQMGINKRLIVLYLFSIILITQSLYGQVREFKPSSTCVSSEKFIDFQPGFRAVKGNYVSAVIADEPIGCNNAQNNTSRIVNVEPDFEAHIEDQIDKNIVTTQFRQGDVAIYPNPFSDQLTVDVFELDENILRIDLFNVQGKLVKNIFYSDINLSGLQSMTVDMADIDHGMYFIKIATDTYIKSKKIFK